MTLKEQEILLGCIFKSELKYYQANKISPTNSRVLHDKEVIGTWVKQLKEDGVELKNYEVDFRQQILDGEIKEIEEKINQVQTEINRLNSLICYPDYMEGARAESGIPLNEDKEIVETRYNKQITHWTLRLNEHNTDLSDLKELKKGQTVFNLV